MVTGAGHALDTAPPAPRFPSLAAEAMGWPILGRGPSPTAGTEEWPRPCRWTGATPLTWFTHVDADPLGVDAIADAAHAPERVSTVARLRMPRFSAAPQCRSPSPTA